MYDCRLLNQNSGANTGHNLELCVFFMDMIYLFIRFPLLIWFEKTKCEYQMILIGRLQIKYERMEQNWFQFSTIFKLCLIVICNSLVKWVWESN